MFFIEIPTLEKIPYYFGMPFLVKKIAVVACKILLCKASSEGVAFPDSELSSPGENGGEELLRRYHHGTKITQKLQVI